MSAARSSIKPVKKAYLIFASVLLLLILAHSQMSSSSAAGTLTAEVSSSPGFSGVNRMGLNIVGNDYDGAGDYMQNLFDNPGFEPSTDGHLIIVGSVATSSSFTDTHDSGAAAGYWVEQRPR